MAPAARGKTLPPLIATLESKRKKPKKMTIWFVPTITAVDACRYLGAILVGALNGTNKEDLLSDHYNPVPGYWQKYPLVKEIGEIAAGSFKYRQPPEIQGSGYVVKSLEAALWTFYKSKTFDEGCLLAKPWR